MLKFYTFMSIHTEPDYDNPDEQGQVAFVETERHRVCLNLDDISSLEETGQWKRKPDAAPRNRNSRNATTSRLRDVYVVDKDRFIVHMKKGQKNVVVLGSFDEFAEIFSQFQQDKETA